MNSASRRIIGESGLISEEREPLNQLTTKMRNRVIKRPKCSRLKLSVMALGVFIVIAVIFLSCSQLTEEIETYTYDGELLFLSSVTPSVYLNILAKYFLSTRALLKYFGRFAESCCGFVYEICEKREIIFVFTLRLLRQSY